MTKSTITREQLEEWVAQFEEDGGCDATDRQLEALIRQSLAAMDSEPVAYISKSDFDAGYPHILARRDFNKACTMAVYAAQPAQVVEREPIAWLNDAYLARGVVDGEAGSEDAGPGYIPVYRHAQPAPVVNGEYGNAYQGAREDLAIWKRRALEAEESVRRLEQINDHLVKEAQGESRMGEPVIARPVPVVPDEMYWQDAPVDGSTRAAAYATGWNACRAAMLAAAPQSPGSDPATVPGKWIPVSERIPDNTEPVLCIEKRADFGTYGQPFVCWHDGGGWVGKTNYRPIVTHWMPLPAAPREVE